MPTGMFMIDRNILNQQEYYDQQECCGQQEYYNQQECYIAGIFVNFT
jgi:hypothetical protein